MDAAAILADLQKRAQDVLADFDVDAKVEDAKAAANRVRERLETDPQARAAATGAGGLLLLGLLGTKGGRGFLGGLAKTGAVAALGALAYKTWNERQGGDGGGETPPDFLIDAQNDPAFAAAIVRAMAAGALADGVIDARERAVINGVAEAGDFDAAARAETDRRATVEEDVSSLAAAATSPNRAAQLYAAATLTADEDHPEAQKFLSRLSDALGLPPKR
ncbi:MAG: DUF533 domain-containing protein [Pseudomonadota bacterium]